MRVLDKINTEQQNIIIGEIGALLHDIGKYNPDFIGKNSIENYPQIFSHSKINSFLKADLLKLIKSKKFEIKINKKITNIYNLITEHHNRNTDDEIVKILQTCDRKDSAYDKGIVREKQSIEDTNIYSPFGYSKEKIDLNCLQKRFEDLEERLIPLFKNYILGKTEINCFRKSLLKDLKLTFSHSLGETRIPANDVTLWDHSYSTASLFKSVLSAFVCGVNPDPKNLKWRIFGVSWNGIGFINTGRKVADIQERNDIIEDIKRELKKKFEDDYPIGNAIYEDTNGVYFTFPDLSSDKSKELAKECAEQVLKIISDESDNELWPIFTLSKTSRSLTILASELKYASEKRKIPKMSSALFVEGKPEKFFGNPEIATSVKGQDVCPVCRIRPKNVKEEKCNVCEKRRKGRRDKWLNNRQDTIWTDEVADKNNRIALISLSFNLDKWLDGTMIGTIYSQSFKDWLDKENENLLKIQYELKEKIIKQIESLEKAIEGMKKAKDSSKVKARIDKKIKEKVNLEQNIKQLTFNLNPDKNTVYRILNIFLKIKDNDKEAAAKILNTFFVENIGLREGTLEEHLSNIKERIQPNNLDKENLAAYLFTQNPSPARLYRMWQETEEFFDLIIREIKDKIYSNKWKRIKFSVNYTELQSKIKQGKIEEKTPYIVQIDNLDPKILLVFHNKDGEFYTIESVEKFKFNSKTGEEAVKEALEDEGFNYLTLENETNRNLLQNKVGINKNSIKIEEYYPLIEINKSPFSLRLIVPTLDFIKIIELIAKLHNERFIKVIGKLALNIKLLVAKRKFPFYIFLDAEKRMLENKEFSKSDKMDPWWDIDEKRVEKYYCYYPIKKIKNGEKYTLDDLLKLSKEKILSLYPGYIDFDFLLGTIDRYNIYYKDGNRGDKDCKLFTRRPYYLYQISGMLKLWDVLSQNISSSQINIIEEMLSSKLRKWREIKKKTKEKVFREFAKSILYNAFGNKWNKLRDETRFFIVQSATNGVLLDTIVLFKHIVKRK